MPELPEVETYVRQLRPQLVGRQFLYVDVFWSRTIAIPDVDALSTRLVNQEVKQLERRGKYLRCLLKSGDELLIHLKMSGRLRVESVGEPRQIHDRVVFGLDNHQELRFNDTRKFGRVYLITAENERSSPLMELGPEPLPEDFTLEKFSQMFKKRTGLVKPLLLNQNFLAGLGNIYVDETLFKAGIHPERKAKSLTDDEIAAIYRNMRYILQQSIDCLGTSFDLFYTGGLKEKSASYQCRLQVYQRTEEPCFQCGQPIERIRVGGRSTHFCPKCQAKENLSYR